MKMIDSLVSSLSAEDNVAARKALEIVSDAEEWGQAIRPILEIETPHQSIRKVFHTVWTVRGHRMREQIADDILLLKALILFLPPYEGGDLTLYRGENLDRWKAGNIGFCWTPEEGIGRMFGRGLNAWATGGVLLCAEVPKKAILAEPNDHSKNLGEIEYTIDARQVGDIQVIEEYPASFKER